MYIKDAVELTRACILFFHAVPEVQARAAASPKNDEEEIRHGYYVMPDAWACNPVLGRMRTFLEKQVGYDLRSLNAGLHKSFATVRDGDRGQLLAQQILNYFSTYGLESLGLEAQAYVPREPLGLEPGAPVRIAVLRRMSQNELKEALRAVAMGSAPVPKDAMPHFQTMLRLLGLAARLDPDACRNKEIRMLLWDARGECPSRGEDFLRYAVWKASGSLLLIKSPEVLAAVKAGAGQLEDWFAKNPDLVPECARVFYRFKPLFLALRANPAFRKPVNRMRRLAVKLKEPAQPEPLGRIACGQTWNVDLIRTELKKVSTGRKAAIINAIRRRRHGAAHVAYAVRNGKFWIGEQAAAPEVLPAVEEACMQALAADLRPRVEGRTVCLPENPCYAFPVSPRQFTGFIPFNSVYQLPKSAICGVHWENVMAGSRESRTDLDLHVNSGSINYSWNTQWDDENDALRTGAAVLFSGDMTDAPRRKGGASEVYFIGESVRNETLQINLNNFTQNGPCPFRLLLEGADEEKITRQSLIGRSLDLAIPMTIEGESMTLGLLDCAADGGKRFIFASGVMAKGIVSRFGLAGKGFAEHVCACADSCLSLREVLELAGARINEKDGDAAWDFDFSIQHASLGAFLRLLEDVPA